MTKEFVLYSYDDMCYYTGRYYVHHGETFPIVTNEVNNARAYKSKIKLKNLLDSAKIPCGGGWYWEIVEVIK